MYRSRPNFLKRNRLMQAEAGADPEPTDVDILRMSEPARKILGTITKDKKMENQAFKELREAREMLEERARRKQNMNPEIAAIPKPSDQPKVTFNELRQFAREQTPDARPMLDLIDLMEAALAKKRGFAEQKSDAGKSYRGTIAPFGDENPLRIYASPQEVANRRSTGEKSRRGQRELFPGSGMWVSDDE